MTNEPKGPEYARGIIAEMRRGTKSAAARRALARSCIAVGNYTEAAKDVWREYLAAETAATEINEMKATLKLHGKGLRELSDESGVSMVTIWRWRNGAGAMMETWTKVKEAYGRLVGG